MMQAVAVGPDIGPRPRSQGPNFGSSMRQSVPLEDTKRSRSNTGASGARPKSRASTTSLHSVTTTTETDQGPGVVPMVAGSRNGQPIFPTDHNGMIVSRGSFDQGQQQPVQNQQEYSIAQQIPGTHAHGMQQPSSFSFEGPSMNQQSFCGPQGHDPFAVQQSFDPGMRSADAIHMPYADFEALENDSAALDDSEIMDGKKKRPSASTQQNELELKRLLEQYQGRRLRDVALEIQRTDNGGGKSEKVKQVFAMLWLQENCQKSSGSVRRDKVFSCYAKRCGNEAVPTLNPASFGKLVRIIFSDVKTRRLGVRGESKYHYVDLSLVPEAERDAEDMGEDFTFKSAADVGMQQMRRSQSQPHILHTPTDAAEFPAPSNAQGYFQQQQKQQTRSASPAEVARPAPPPPSSKMMECKYLGQPVIPINTSKLPQGVKDALNQQLPRTASGSPYLITYLAHPPQTPTSSNPEEQIELPDIHQYLQGETYDISIANSLTNLYRTHCICVIDSFRYCKEKPFFHHHSAFNGNMTVPVQKLMSHELLAPWILECDMRMYKRMIGFVAGLTTQVVPKPVMDTFGRICSKLVNHIIESFEKMPSHVIAAKVIPATRFVHLLSKLPKVNHLAQSTHTLLQNSGNRTQMWLDLLQMTDPSTLIEEAHFTPDALEAAEGLFRYEYKALLTPMDESLTSQFENNNIAWTSFFTTGPPPSEHTMSPIADPVDLVDSGHLDRWIQHLTNLHLHFPDHSPKCIINHHTSLWKAILTELGLNAASTYQCWWQLDIFLSAMMSWLTELAGFGDDEVKQAQDRIEHEKKNEDEERVKAWEDYRAKKAEWNAYHEQHRQRQRETQDQRGTKRKRDDADTGGTTRQQKRNVSPISTNGTQSASTSRPTTGNATTYHLASPLGELNASTSQMKNQKRDHSNAANDDSGIGLDINIEDDVDVDSIFRDPTSDSPGLSKFGLKSSNKDNWGILSDPADASGDVVVL